MSTAYKAALVGMVICAAGAAPSLAMADGFYVAGAIGAVAQQPIDSVFLQQLDPFGFVISTPGGASVPYQVDRTAHYDAGFEADISVGYLFQQSAFGDFRTEVEASFRRASLDRYDFVSAPGQISDVTLSGVTTRISGQNFERSAATANLFYDFTKVRGFTPYVGFGVGYQSAVLTAGSSQRTGTTTGYGQTIPILSVVNFPKASASDGTYLAEVGLSVPIGPRFSVVPAYRFTQAFSGKDAASALKVGLRYQF